ncbi:antitoxin YezG family protein [Moraxella nasibovis]|uniref:immunity protein YezG family protein n=1 Tax=Moraxella nasibovis TaxID=2904120 RepID=UPI0024102B6B|nr:immunity protein YezG family protein [Moraxella nasibovis]WFF39430.1 antitoxin YezG family protein [Moraxella nasibovis]
MKNNLGHIYQNLANSLLINMSSESWDKIILKSDILRDNASSIRFILYDKGSEVSQELTFETAFAINDLLIELRNIMLHSTGHRIWGLLFTLYPDGNFEIEYDYNKPEDYEESDDIILGDEINQSLDKLGIR